MSIQYRNIHDWHYPKVRISSRIREIIYNDGLIEPLVIYKDGEIYEPHRERFMAFKSLAMSDPDGARTVITIKWDDLSLNDQRGL